MTADLKTLSPVEVDVLYLARLAAYDRAAKDAEYAALAVVRTAGYVVSTARIDGLGRRRGDAVYVHPACGLTRYGTHDWAAVEPHVLTVERVAAEGLAPEAVLRLAAEEERLGEARVACRECEAEYESRPWARYWLVTSSDGHIHASRRCSTCNKGRAPTGFALAAYLSGKSEAEAVADLGPALCSVCYPSAPVESREQARISSGLALALREHGCEAFQKARAEAAAKASQKAASRCHGSGQQGTPDTRPGYPSWVVCPCCGESSRKTSTGKIRPHSRPLFYVENRDYKCWTGSGWGPSTKKAIFENKDEAAAVAASYPGASVRRK
jgi:hypothetical protein